MSKLISKELLKYGDHTKTCATREYHENQHGGFHSYKGLPCNCGWDDLKKGLTEELEQP
jgi:hypothetical protein